MQLNEIESKIKGLRSLREQNLENERVVEDIDRKILALQNQVPEFTEGDQVLYLPDHSTGPDDTVNERGIVSKVEGSGIDAKVWVRYSTGSTGALTPLKNLVKR